jgi:hypothetical protein
VLTVRPELTDRMLNFGERYLRSVLTQGYPDMRCTTTGSGRIERCKCAHHARKHMFPSQPTAGSSLNQSSAD